jgi:hypothetical protein
MAKNYTFKHGMVGGFQWRRSRRTVTTFQLLTMRGKLYPYDVAGAEVVARASLFDDGDAHG